MGGFQVRILVEALFIINYLEFSMAVAPVVNKNKVRTRLEKCLSTIETTNPVGIPTPPKPPDTELNSSEVQLTIEDQHSQENNNTEVRDKILEAALSFVPHHGWSQASISAGAEALGYPGVIHGMFPKGGFEIVHYFYQKSNNRLIEGMKVDAADRNLTTKKSEKEIITEAVEKRLRMIEPYIGQWAQALALTTLPPNVPTALANLLTLVDDICFYAGDRSVDMTWYGKRIFLAGIYKATELYMLQDKSDDYTLTWLFLRRRMDEATQLHSYIAQSEQASQFAKEFTSAAFVTARNILGMNWKR